LTDNNQGRYEDDQDRLEFDTPTEGADPRVFEVGASTSQADEAKLQLQLVFPRSMGLRRHTLLVPASLTVRALMEGLSSKIGAARLPIKGSSLAVDPEKASASEHFRQSESFPYLDPDSEISAYRDLLMRSTLFWIRSDL
jgi:hypothetical protein